VAQVKRFRIFRSAGLILLWVAPAALAQQTPAPRGAFLGAGAEQGGLNAVWFWLGCYVLAGLVFGALAAHRALQTGNRALPWFFAGLLFSLPGYLFLLTRPKREVTAPGGVPVGLKKMGTTYEPTPCVRCGEMNHPAATECIGCGGKLTPRVASEVHRAGMGHR
jgi:hypothetical protein